MLGQVRASLLEYQLGLCPQDIRLGLGIDNILNQRVYYLWVRVWFRYLMHCIEHLNIARLKIGISQRCWCSGTNLDSIQLSLVQSLVAYNFFQVNVTFSYTFFKEKNLEYFQYPDDTHTVQSHGARPSKKGSGETVEKVWRCKNLHSSNQIALFQI